MAEIEISVPGVHCEACRRSIEAALVALAGGQRSTSAPR